jgi:HAE1 family hydrophobic/amphiphilic exporter-1
MDPIKYAIQKPVTVMVGVILLVLFGLISLFKLPIQLTPNVDKPEITVTTTWEGASPQEVEREIIEEQEERLKSIRGLKKMTSTSIRGRGRITLEFHIETDMSRALLDTSDKLRQVPEYPENVNEPVVQTSATSESRAIAWFVLESNPPREDIATLNDLLEDVIKPRLERVTGVSSVNIYGGIEREVHVKIDPVKLASRSLKMGQIREALDKQNLDISGGNIDQGKRSYTIRTVGQYRSIEDILDTVILRDRTRVIYLKDVANAGFAYKEQNFVVRTKGKPTMAMNATKESGSNVIMVMKGLKNALGKVNEQILEPRNLRLVQVYDETIYINSAINLVIQNIWKGGLLATSVILVFLAHFRSTMVIGFAIPISIIGTFLFMVFSGRNLNVISLAGMAFAVGMVVDNSIVILENIFRHLQKGESPWEASWRGAKEVWGAVLASTLTTMAVFIPVILMKEEAGQLFRDIALAICFAIGLSLSVSVFVIPTVTAHLFKTKTQKALESWKWITFIHRFGSAFKNLICNLVVWINRGIIKRIAVISGITCAAILITIFLIPPMTYLPAGNQNLVIGFLIPPPGYSREEFLRMGREIEGHLTPYWEAELGSEEAKRLQGPPIESYFYVAIGQAVFMGARSKDPRRVKPLENVIKAAASKIPGVFAFAFQRSLFERGISSGNSIDLEISGDDMEAIKKAGVLLIPAIARSFGFPRPDPPNFNLGGAEIIVKLDQDRAREMGLNVQEAGFIVRTMVDGAVIGDYWDKDKKIDLKLISSIGTVKTTDDLDSIPVATKDGRLVPLSSFVNLIRSEGPTQINHIEERRAIKLIISPPPGMELELAMKKLLEEIVAPLREKGLLSKDIDINLAGTADKLTSARKALQWNFLLAVVIIYLLLASLFESFLYPFVIMFSVPLAAVGGVIALAIVHYLTGQQMDILTMLGFIILIGAVVNNAILIVHQSLNFIRKESMDPQKAIVEALRIRIRPIFMSAMTSCFGMLPLVLSQGAGNELYRGLGSVVIGGILASSLFTVIVIPSLFSLVLSLKRQKIPALQTAPVPSPSQP